MGIPKLWGKDKSGNHGFVFSHVKTIYYNWASKILLKTKLDEMDALIDAKIAKAMMSNQQVNDANKVPTSALAYAMQQAITQNANGISDINSNLQYKELTSGFDLNNALGRYRSGATSIVKSLVNAPPELANAYEIIVEWYQAQSNNAYGIQLIYCRLGISGSADSRQYIRSRNADKWNAWEQVTLKSDLRNIIYSGGVTSTEFDHRQDSGYYILGMYDVINPKTGVTFDIDYTNGQLRLYRIENGVGTFVGRVTLQK